MKQRSALTVIFVTVFIFLVGFGIVIPILPRYAEDYGATPLQATMLLSAHSLMQFLAAPLWGRISDRVGRRPTILVSIGVSVIGYVIFALARSVPVLYLSRIVSGVGGASIAVTQAYIADTTTPENRSRGMGLIGMAFGLGFIFGPVIGGVATRFFGLSGPGWAATIICLVNFVGALVWLPESLPTERRRTRVALGPRAAVGVLMDSSQAIVHALRLRGVGIGIIVYFSAVLAFSNLEATFSLFLGSRLQLEKDIVYWLFAYFGILMAITQGGLIHPLTVRFREKKLAVFGTFACGIGLLGMADVRSTAALILVCVPVAFGNGLNMPSLMSLISQWTPADDYGRILGASQSAASLARIAGPAVGGALMGVSGDGAPYVFGGALMLATGLLALFYLKGKDSGAKNDSFPRHPLAGLKHVNGG